MIEIIEINGIKIKTHPKVYVPAEDSELLIENLVDVQNKTVLDVGTGSGIQAINAVKQGALKVIGIDINPYAVECAKINSELNEIDSKKLSFKTGDLFKNIDEKFDVILFNAPYLPTSDEEKLEKYLNYAFDGGKDGREVLDKFLDEVANYLKKDGIIQILQSSLTDGNKTIEKMEKLGFVAKQTGSLKFSFEELQVITGWKK
ncbi:HemK2/MTQ2 family protein methyltransferase [Methanococcus maripaludis]|uniref:50S ribosomal protein L3 glutamine methyltransferase n=1 Tax=Methanococcus maripaludis TaxID=39152 RepID=A0A2L1CB37_METMI|nr:HemK2/MTQ2 family protein methyltransferase [Methanococcus maripaludis]AVB76440.1 50S ribosomal protein L3 glutamine methyltransferase [Methanococcus maripaludis]MBA2864750.1 release factor glutamine methyltransferase [Methanococcus maripaludis]MBB6497711.1 release factor glutamine methyltransferase [Methanococcus maripaludis]